LKAKQQNLTMTSLKMNSLKMTSYNKQQTVQLLPLCFDVADLINSFLFESIESFIKDKKKEIVKKFKNAVLSRKNDLEEHEDADTREHWAICLQPVNTGTGTDTDIVKEKQFQAINCQICGNYKEVSLKFIPDKIMCVHTHIFHL